VDKSELKLEAFLPAKLCGKRAKRRIAGRANHWRKASKKIVTVNKFLLEYIFLQRRCSAPHNPDPKTALEIFSAV
jgi:hypothetical protein